MPLPKLTPPSTGGGGGLPKLNGDDTVLPPLSGGKQPPPDDGGLSTGAEVGIGAATLGGLAALALREPEMAGKLAKGLNTLRQQLMLSGYALPKSLLGNAGAAIEASLEGGSIAPLREMFSGDTVRDAVDAWKRGAAGGAAQAGQAPVGGNVVTRVASMLSPGRVMGAFDEAAQAALRRGGLSAKDAESVAMQAPLPTGLADALDNPVARYVHPFRRQPFYQFMEGWKKFGADNLQRNPGVLAAYLGAGAAHGAVTADDDMPVSIPFAAAGAARYGLPYAAAALIGRSLAGGKGYGDIASSALPVSEYGFESSITNPTRPFVKPAALTALEKLTQ